MLRLRLCAWRFLPATLVLLALVGCNREQGRPEQAAVELPKAIYSVFDGSDREYFPPGPEFKLWNEATSITYAKHADSMR